MSADVPTANQSGGTTDEGTESVTDGLVDDLARSFTVGTDADGKDHHYFRPADAIVVFDATGEEGVEHYHYLEGAVLWRWIEHVDEKRGWLCKGPHADLGVTEDRKRKEGQ